MTPNTTHDAKIRIYYHDINETFSSSCKPLVVIGSSSLVTIMKFIDLRDLLKIFDCSLYEVAIFTEPFANNLFETKRDDYAGPIHMCLYLEEGSVESPKVVFDKLVYDAEDFETIIFEFLLTVYNHIKVNITSEKKVKEDTSCNSGTIGTPTIGRPSSLRPVPVATNSAPTARPQRVEGRSRRAPAT